MKITKRAQFFLREKKISQQELAKEIGVHPVALNRFLKGNSGQETILAKLENFLEENGYPHDFNVTQETSKEERENAS